MISYPREVRVDETGQNAIVAWNGSEEVLILSTDVTSSEPATVLRIMVLPSCPTKVEEGSFDSFKNLTAIVNRKARDIRSTADKRPGGFGSGPEPKIVIKFQEKIGVHDVTIVEVNDQDAFIYWVEDFTTKNGFESTNLSSEFKYGISDYLNRDIKYFVFDVIETGNVKESVNPLVYVFESDYLYYPMEITAISDVGESRGKVTIFLITEGMVRESAVTGVGLSPIAGFQYHIELSKEELNDIHPYIADLFSPAYVMNTYHFGYLHELNNDLLIYPEDIHIPTRFERIAQPISVFFSRSVALQFILEGWEEFSDRPPHPYEGTVIVTILLSFLAGVLTLIVLIARSTGTFLGRYNLETVRYNRLIYAISILVVFFLLLTSNYTIGVFAIGLFIIVGFLAIILVTVKLLQKYIFL